MRKFKRTKKNQERITHHKPKKKWFNLTVGAGIFIIIIMVFSVVGFLNSDDGNAYNGVKFFQTAQGWFAKTKIGRLAFMYHPTQVEFLDLPAGAVQTLQEASLIYFTHDPEDPYKELHSALSFSFFDLIEKENKKYNKEKTVLFAVSKKTNETAEKTMVIDCKDANAISPVVHFETLNESDRSLQSNITFEQNCITIQGTSPYDVIQFSDRLQYGYLGIIEEGVQVS